MTVRLPRSGDYPNYTRGEGSAGLATGRFGADSAPPDLSGHPERFWDTKNFYTPDFSPKDYTYPAYKSMWDGEAAGDGPPVVMNDRAGMTQVASLDPAAGMAKGGFSYIAPATGEWAPAPQNYFHAARGDKGREHSGNDIRAPKGSPAVAMIGGKVIYVGQNKGYNWNAVVLGDDGNAYRYATHGPLSVKLGQKVDQGDKIGTIDANSPGGMPHLHFEIIPPTIDGKPNKAFQTMVDHPGEFVSTQFWPSRKQPAVTINPADFFGVSYGDNIVAGKSFGDPSKSVVKTANPMEVADPFGVGAMQTGAPDLADALTGDMVNPRLPVSVARAAELRSNAEAVAAAGGSKPTLTVDDMNASPRLSYAQQADANASRYASIPWPNLKPEEQQALTERFGDKAPQTYETMRAGLPGATPAAAGPRLPTALASADGEAALSPGGPSGATRAMGVTLSPRDIDIGARTILGEAANQGDAGMKAIAGVLANRANSKFNGKTSIADVALDGNGAQFNATKNGGNKPYRAGKPGDPLYDKAANYVKQAAAGTLDTGIGNADYYFNPKTANPSWAKGFTKIGSVGDHVFFSSGGAEVPRLSKESLAEPAVSAGLPASGHPPLLARGAGTPDKPNEWTSFLQQKLKTAYPETFKNLDVDGAYGPQTESAVKAFSHATNDPKPNGKAGPHVWGTLAKMAPEEGFGPFPRLRPNDVSTPDETGFPYQNPASRSAKLDKAGQSEIIAGLKTTNPASFVSEIMPPAAVDTPRIRATGNPDRLMAVRDQAGGNQVNRADKRDALPRIQAPDWSTPLDWMPGADFVKSVMTKAMPNVDSIPMMLRGMPGPAFPPALVQAPEVPDTSTLGDRASGLMTIVRQLVAGAGLADRGTLGLPVSAPRPRIVPPAVSAGESDPAQFAARTAQAAQPGAIFSTPEPGASPSAAASSNGDAAAAAKAAQSASAGGVSPGSGSNAASIAAETNNPNSIEQAIEALKNAIDSMGMSTIPQQSGFPG